MAYNLLKWLFKRSKTPKDLETEDEVLIVKEMPEVQPIPKAKQIAGRILEKGNAPDPQPGKFSIEYGPGYEPKNRQKVLLQNGLVLHSEWYRHPWLGQDGWIRQPSHFSIPKINKMIERDERARNAKKQNNSQVEEDWEVQE
jgi:hypothetical protein